MPAHDDNPFRLRRRALGLSQVELARRAGVTRATIAQIEEGRVKEPNHYVVEELAKGGQPTSPDKLRHDYLLWKNDDPTKLLSDRGRNTLLLPPSFVAQYRDFPQWRQDVAGNPTSFSSLTKVPRSTIMKFERGETTMPSSLYYALINRLHLSEEYVTELRKLDVAP